MSLLSIWVAMLGMGLITLLLRSSFLLLPDQLHLPPLLRRALRYVPAAVLTAIYAPELLVKSGAIDDSLRRTFFTIVAGMLALHGFGAAIASLQI